MSESHVLPVSNHKAQAQHHTPGPTNIIGPSFWAFLKRRLELVDCSAISRPTSLSDATTSIRKNISHFRVNYLAVLASILVLSLLYHPSSLLTLLSLLASWLFLYLLRPFDQPVVVLNRSFSGRETLGILIFLTVFVIFLTTVGSLLMSATLIGLGIVSVHGAFTDPEDLFLDDQELPGSGLFSYIKTAASSAGVNAVIPSVVVSSA